MIKKLVENGRTTTVSIHPLQLEQLGWNLGDKVDVTVKGKKIIIEKKED